MHQDISALLSKSVLIRSTNVYCKHPSVRCTGNSSYFNASYIPEPPYMCSTACPILSKLFNWTFLRCLHVDFTEQSGLGEVSYIFSCSILILFHLLISGLRCMCATQFAFISIYIYIYIYLLAFEDTDVSSRDPSWPITTKGQASGRLYSIRTMELGVKEISSYILD